MSPTVLREKNFRFFFFSREEQRKHIHIECSGGEAKFWLEPYIVLANNYGLSDKQINQVKKIIEKNHEDFITKWEQYFSRSN